MRGVGITEETMILGNPKTAQTVRPKVRLLDSVRETIRRKHYSLRTESTYIDWIKRYILFHGLIWQYVFPDSFTSRWLSDGISQYRNSVQHRGC
jgi:Phage integrase, N-terminal SAM-like domain